VWLGNCKVVWSSCDIVIASESLRMRWVEHILCIQNLRSKTMWET